MYVMAEQVKQTIMHVLKQGLKKITPQLLTTENVSHNSTYVVPSEIDVWSAANGNVSAVTLGKTLEAYTG